MEEMTVGRLIKLKRKKVGLTAEKLADRIGVDRTYISKIENHGLVPSKKILLKITSVLKDNPTNYMISALQAKNKELLKSLERFAEGIIETKKVRRRRREGVYSNILGIRKKHIKVAKKLLSVESTLKELTNNKGVSRDLIQKAQKDLNKAIKLLE